MNGIMSWSTFCALHKNNNFYDHNSPPNHNILDYTVFNHKKPYIRWIDRKLLKMEIFTFIQCEEFDLGSDATSEKRKM